MGIPLWLPRTNNNGRGTAVTEQRLFRAFDLPRYEAAAYNRLPLRQRRNGGALAQQPKAALTAKLDRHHWVEQLPLVLLGLRFTAKEDLGFRAAEMVYGSTVHLPVGFSDQTLSAPATSDHIEKLRAWLAQLKPTAPCIARSRNLLTFPDKESATDVFVRHDATKPPLTPPYKGPFKVLGRTNKTITIDVRGNREVIAVDRAKPAQARQAR